MFRTEPVNMRSTEKNIATCSGLKKQIIPLGDTVYYFLTIEHSAGEFLNLLFTYILYLPHQGVARTTTQYTRSRSMGDGSNPRRITLSIFYKKSRFRLSLSSLFSNNDVII